MSPIFSGLAMEFDLAGLLFFFRNQIVYINDDRESREEYSTPTVRIESGNIDVTGDWVLGVIHCNNPVGHEKDCGCNSGQEDDDPQSIEVNVGHGRSLTVSNEKRGEVTREI